MFRYRIILGLLIGLVLIGLLALDSRISSGWPVAEGSTPPGLLVTVGMVVVIPFGLYEMQGLLARENVMISLRITIAAAMLCMLWPWAEQVADRVGRTHAALQAQVAAEGAVAGPVSAAQTEATLDELHRVERSPWYLTSRVFRSVKPEYLVPTVLALSLVAAVVKHSRHRRVDGAMANAGGTLLAIVYLGVLPGFYLPICMTHSAWMVLAVVAIVKCADIGAYGTGRLIGRHKLIPWLSPGKTVEGFIGGIAFSAVVGGGIGWYLRTSLGGVGGDPERWKGIAPALARFVGGGFGRAAGGGGAAWGFARIALEARCGREGFGRSAGVWRGAGYSGFAALGCPGGLLAFETGASDAGISVDLRSTAKPVLRWRGLFGGGMKKQPYDILQIDEALVAINKPPGLSVLPGRGRNTNLLDLLATDAALGGKKPLPVHRIDADTSGVLVFALTPEAQRAPGGAIPDEDGGKGILGAGVAGAAA